MLKVDLFVSLVLLTILTYYVGPGWLHHIHIGIWCAYGCRVAYQAIHSVLKFINHVKRVR